MDLGALDIFDKVLGIITAFKSMFKKYAFKVILMRMLKNLSSITSHADRAIFYRD